MAFNGRTMSIQTTILTHSTQGCATRDNLKSARNKPNKHAKHLKQLEKQVVDIRNTVNVDRALVRYNKRLLKRIL